MASGTGNDNVPVTIDAKQSKVTLPITGGYGAIAMNNALAATMTELPEQLRRSLTCNQRPSPSRA